MDDIRFHRIDVRGLSTSSWDVTATRRDGSAWLGSVQRFRDGGWRAFDRHGNIVGDGVFIHTTRRAAVASLVEHHSNAARWRGRIDLVRSAEIPGFVS